MHSRIFVLSKNKEINHDDITLPFVDDGQYISPLIDYVAPSDSFEEDVNWLEEIYGIKVSWDGNKPYLSSEALMEMKNKIENNLKNRVDRIKKLIREAEKGNIEFDDWLLYRIADIAWNALGFFFHIIEDGTPRNEPEFLNYINSHKTDPLWIVTTYDYHF